MGENMKRRIVIAIAILLFSLTVQASMFGEEDSILTAQLTQLIMLNKNSMNNTALFSGQMIPQITNMIQSLNKIYSMWKQLHTIGNRLRKLSKQNWLRTAQQEITKISKGDFASTQETVQRFDRFSKELDSKYKRYFSEWSEQAIAFGKKKAAEYEKNILRGKATGLSLARMAIYRSWRRAGMGKEMLFDSKYREHFYDMYHEFREQSVKNKNLGQRLMTAILHSSHLGYEELNSLRKRADMKTLEEQFSQDSVLHYLKNQAKQQLRKTEKPFSLHRNDK